MRVIINRGAESRFLLFAGDSQHFVEILFLLLLSLDVLSSFNHDLLICFGHVDVAEAQENQQLKDLSKETADVCGNQDRYQRLCRRPLFSEVRRVHDVVMDLTDVEGDACTHVEQEADYVEHHHL